ncbi:MAG: TetR/AcrR family transcriptional regulator [Syntrophomonadaceae bacterium]|nr:TetR/AcrR family transcriptional regulator [Syntrophomonadaceae bacterium]
MQQERGKRERILEAAQTVFARKGYYQAKIEEIAELAGVGKGTVYEYFVSKEELYKEMFKVILNRYTEYVMVEATPEMTTKEWIRHLLEMHLRYMLENRQHMPTNFGDLGGMDTEILGWMYDMRKRSVNRLVPVFQKGIDRGELKGMDPELGANLLIGMMRGVTLPLMVEGTYGEPSQVAEAMTEILFHGIAR